MVTWCSGVILCLSVCTVYVYMSWIQIPPEAARSFSEKCLGCAVLFCCFVVCMALLAFLFLPSASFIQMYYWPPRGNFKGGVREAGGGGAGRGEEESVDRAGDPRPHQEPQPRAVEVDSPHRPLPQRQQPAGIYMV